jgi:DegV family protein with EDD domain
VIGIVVDSNSQMSPSLARRLAVTVVPLVVRIGGTDHREGIDLDADAFYEYWTSEGAPPITTSQPSPGAFLEVYQQLIGDGVTEILSVHMAASMSGTLNSAAVAARSVDVPVRLVDTSTASFGVTCCAWAAVDAIAAGASIEDAARVAERRAATLATAFIVGVPELIDRSGRAAGLEVGAAAALGIPVLAGVGGELKVVASVDTVASAVDAMAEYALAHPPANPGGLRVAIGTSDRSSFGVGEALTERLTGRRELADIVQYRVGPSVGAHTGPGTAGLFVF